MTKPVAPKFPEIATPRLDEIEKALHDVRTTANADRALVGAELHKVWERLKSLDKLFNLVSETLTAVNNNTVKLGEAFDAQKQVIESLHSEVRVIGETAEHALDEVYSINPPPEEEEPFIPADKVRSNRILSNLDVTIEYASGAAYREAYRFKAEGDDDMGEVLMDLHHALDRLLDRYFATPHSTED